MAKTVDQFGTIEDFRTRYNELAIDVGDKSGLRTTDSSTLVDALNSLEDKSFFFQEFVYTASASQTTSAFMLPCFSATSCIMFTSDTFADINVL